MSFRVKQTHDSLPMSTPKKVQEQLSFFDEKTSYLRPIKDNNTKKKENRPREGSIKGMSIREVTTAQADHM